MLVPKTAWTAETYIAHAETASLDTALWHGAISVDITAPTSMQPLHAMSAAHGSPPDPASVAPLEPLLDPLLEPLLDPLLEPPLDPPLDPLLDPLEPLDPPLLDPLLLELLLELSLAASASPSDPVLPLPPPLLLLPPNPPPLLLDEHAASSSPKPPTDAQTNLPIFSIAASSSKVVPLASRKPTH
jgi:hypothetical protein